MFRKCSGLLGVGVLTAGVVFIPVAAFAVDSGAAGTPATVIAGHISGSDGRALSAGAPVVLYTTPSQDKLITAKEGDSFVNTPIARGSVNGDGVFSLLIADPASLSSYASRDGLLNLEVQAADSNDFSTFSLTRKIVTVNGHAALVDPSDLSNSSAAATPAQVTAGNKAVSITAQAATLPTAKKLVKTLAKTTTVAADEPIADETADPTVGPQDPTADPTDGSGGHEPDPSDTAAPDWDTRPPGSVGGPDKPATQSCGEDLIKDLGSKKVIVGSSYANAGGTTGTFTFSKGASSEIGVAVSTSGSAGSYKLSGTTSVTSKSTIDYGKRSGGVSYSTYFEFGKWAKYCYPIGGRKTDDSYYSWQVRSYRYNGGSSVNASTTPTATKCTAFSGGTTLTKDTSAANTWSSGASVPEVNVSISSKTGYSTTAKLSYKNSGSTARKVCGTNDVWGGSPKRAVTK